MVKKIHRVGANIFSSAHFSASENALSMWTKYVNDKADNEESTKTPMHKDAARAMFYLSDSYIIYVL